MVGFTALYGIVGMALWAHGGPVTAGLVGFTLVALVFGVAGMIVGMIALGFAPEANDMGPGCFVACLVELASIVGGGRAGMALAASRGFAAQWGALAGSFVALALVAAVVALALRARRPKTAA